MNQICNYLERREQAYNKRKNPLLPRELNGVGKHFLDAINAVRKKYEEPMRKLQLFGYNLRQ